MELDLTGKFLIAMPGMLDPRFDHAVVYMCSHDDDGAMGLIINKPAPGVRFVELLGQLGIDHSPDTPDIRVHIGGPVETERGFVLHTLDYRSEAATLDLNDGIGLTATLDILKDLGAGEGPERALLALGYSGWGAGQLEAELAQNAWITAPATPDAVFGRAHDLKWAGALKSIGVDPRLLTGEGGRA